MAKTALPIAILSLLLGAPAAHAKDPATYVALGSSYAAGFGLGPNEPGSPAACARSSNGYPHLLARRLGLPLTDASCSGSTTAHILHGGQAGLPAQLDAVGPGTRLVTITSGGNDVGYVGDLIRASRTPGLAVKPLAERDFDAVGANFRAIAGEIRRRAPKARIVFVSYPPIVPPQGTCATLGVDPAMADLAYRIGLRLDAVTRGAAARSCALFVDMGAIGAGHDACATAPWINGAAPAEGGLFHPDAAGAQATADAVFAALRKRPPAR